MTETFDLKRRLAAVMFTDMAGYTALMQRDEAAALRSRQRHRDALERHVPSHDGEILQYFGDGSLSIFQSSLEAVEAAIEIQRCLGGEPPLRIGLHLGDIAYDEQGAYGDAINIAARLEALSAPGGILVSDKVFDDIRRHPRLVAVPTGAVRLKNVADAIRTYALAVDGVSVPEAMGTDGRTDGVDAVAPLPPEVRARLDERTRHLAFSRPVGTVPARIPMVGRVREMELVRTLLDQAEQRRGGTTFFRGPRGIGKSRLGQEAAEYTRTRGWSVLTGRAYPAEGMTAFAPFSDAFLPVLQGLDAAVLRQIAPGGEDALVSLFPPLGSPGRRLHEADGQPGEPQARVFWHFASLVGRLAEYRPLLLIIEDLDFADRSSLELFHFLARQCTDKPIFFIGQYTGMEPKRKRELLSIEQSLLATGAGTVVDLGPLAEAETEEFIRSAFDVEGRNARELAATVHRWTGGNPFFLTGTLRGLVEARVITRQDGEWRGLDVGDIKLPHALRDSVVVWMSNVSEPALELARLIAIVGRQVTYEVLLQISRSDRDAMSDALDELLRHQILSDAEERFTLVYDFRHPLIREALRGELSLSERRNLHYQVATRLEEYYGDGSERHADELAYHFGQTHPGQAGTKAIRYLATAGFAALDRYANQEAVSYLQEALDRIEARPAAEMTSFDDGHMSAPGIMGGLARARRRLGKVQASVALWRRVLALAEAAGSPAAVAEARREIGLSFMAGGRFEEAIEELELTLEGAGEATQPDLVIRLLLAQGYCLHAVGRGERGEDVVRRALRLAEEVGRPELVGRVHSALMLMHIWTGRLDEVRHDAETALALARECGDTSVEFWSEWAMGAMEGLIGRTQEMARRVEKARRLAEEVGSPLLRLEVAELEIELLYARGEWDEALTVGEGAIELARSLDARTILPRLLVWVSQIHNGRGSLEIADELTREAWDVSGADAERGGSGVLDVHTVVPAHIGRAAFHLTRGDWGDAARYAEAGLAIADRTGYALWAIHQLLPILGEACIHARNLPRAREVGARMRAQAEALGHPLGLAWADTCDAVLSWLDGDARRGAVALRKAAEALEGIPLRYEASRLRRQLAGRLAEVGDREGALSELHRVHEAFSRLGARPELAKAVSQFRELGAEPPA